MSANLPPVYMNAPSRRFVHFTALSAAGYPRHGMTRTIEIAPQSRYGTAACAPELPCAPVKADCVPDLSMTGIWAVGLLGEEFDPATSRMLGNFPQAFSHVGLINNALNLSRQQG